MQALRLMMMAVMVSFVTSVSAMSYGQARKQAMFLTDKMAYELQLNDQQYAAAYEINLDYLMAVSNVNDVFGSYWARRDADLRYVLANWQYALSTSANYFYQPLSWNNNRWYFPVYKRYSNRKHFYFSHPQVYYSYRGGYHSGNNKYYSSRNWNRPAKKKDFDTKDKYRYNRYFNNRKVEHGDNGNHFGNMKNHKGNGKDYNFGNNRNYSKNNGNFGDKGKDQSARRFGNANNGQHAKKQKSGNGNGKFGEHR